MYLKSSGKMNTHTSGIIIVTNIVQVITTSSKEDAHL